MTGVNHFYLAPRKQLTQFLPEEVRISFFIPLHSLCGAGPQTDDAQHARSFSDRELRPAKPPGVRRPIYTLARLGGFQLVAVQRHPQRRFEEVSGSWFVSVKKLYGDRPFTKTSKPLLVEAPVPDFQIITRRVGNFSQRPTPSLVTTSVACI